MSAAATVSRAQALAQANALARRSRLSTTPSSCDTAGTSPSVLSTTYGVRALPSQRSGARVRARPACRHSFVYLEAL